MSIREVLDALFKEAEQQGARPFRLDLQETEIAQLLDEGAIVPPGPTADSSRGSYRDVQVYPAGKISELLAQPEDDMRALHLKLE